MSKIINTTFSIVSQVRISIFYDALTISIFVIHASASLLQTTTYRVDSFRKPENAALTEVVIYGTSNMKINLFMNCRISMGIM